MQKAEDLFERELLVGGDGAGTSLSEMPTLLKNLLGMKFKIVDGYKGSTGVVLAMERNEVAGICQTVIGFCAIRPAPAGRRHGTHPVHHRNASGCRDLKVPTIFEYAKTDEQRDILAFHASSLETGRPWLAPPNVPRRSGRGVAPRLRRHHEGPGVPR